MNERKLAHCILPLLVVSLPSLAVASEGWDVGQEPEKPTEQPPLEEVPSTGVPISGSNEEAEKPIEIYGNTWVFLAATGPWPINFGKIEIARLRWEYFQLSVAKASLRHSVFYSYENGFIMGPNFGILGLGTKYHFLKELEIGVIIYPLSYGITDTTNTDMLSMGFLNSTVYFRVNFYGFAFEIGTDFPLIAIRYVAVPIIYLGFGY